MSGTINKKIWAVHFNDIHIKSGNEEDVYNGIKYLVKYCVENGVKDIICGGDVFDSRSFQRLSHLKCWEKCLDLFKVNGITCWCNTGNHDKSLYNIEDNFIEPFKYHPSIKLFSNITNVKINGKNVTISPFFEDKILCKQLEEIDGCEVLIGHWSCDGSTYLGKVDENKVINKKLLSKWDRVFLSHYHNHHEVNGNTTHLPSLLQDNFGEDNNKGFSVIYDDLTYEIIKGKFRELVKVVVDINETPIKELKEKIDLYKNSDSTVRFELSGDESKLKSINKSIFSDFGIDVKLKFNKNYTLEVDKNKKTVLKEVYKESDIRKEFKKFCDNRGYDYSFGLDLLNKFLKDK